MQKTYRKQTTVFLIIKQGRGIVKAMYKILFSICSTLVCFVHHVSAYDADCGSQLTATLPSDATGEPTWGYGTTHGCANYTKHYLKTMAIHGDRNTILAYVYAKVINCTACKRGYTREVTTFEVSSDYAKCNLTVGLCNADTSYTPTQTCTTDAECVTQLGSDLFVSYVPDYTTGEAEMGHVLYQAKCGKNKHCQWIMSVANSASWSLMDTSTGKWGLNSAAKCVNGHYGGAVLISEASKLYVQFCQDCPDIDAEYIGGTPDYLQGSGVNVGGCYIKAGAKFRNTVGDFETTGTCVY